MGESATVGSPAAYVNAVIDALSHLGHHQHRHAGHVRQGVGGAAQQGGDRIDDGLLTLLAENATTGRACALATVVRTESPTSAHPGDKAVITDDGELHGWIGGSCSDALIRREALVAMSDGLPRLVRIRPDVEALETRNGGELTVATTCPSGGTLDIFIDPHLPKPLLAVIGESPAGRTLIELGRVVGFRTCGVHPGAQAADFPGADRVLDTPRPRRARPGEGLLGRRGDDGPLRR